MSMADIIIILILLFVMVFVIYFSFIKNRHNKCYGCPYAKACNKGSCKKGN